MAEYFFGITDKGKRREKNEDTFLVQKVFNNEFVVACVIDGVGGYSGGEVAAGIAKAVIAEHLQNLSGNIIETLQHAVVAANAKIYQERSNEQNDRMACVLTCAVTHIKNNKFYYAHVGDTRLYLLRDRSLVKISKDHSVVGYLEESGRLTEEDAMRHPRRNEINKALGFEEQISNPGDYIETGESPFLPGDTLLLCSDGLSDMIGSGTITSILNNNKKLAERAQDLVNAANDAGGNDNITAVMVNNYKPAKKQTALKPTGKREVVERGHLPQAMPAIQQARVIAKGSGKRIINSLALLSLLLLIALSFLFFQQRTVAKNNNPVTQTTAPLQKDVQLIKLIADVTDTTKAYASLTGVALMLNETVVINKDSFYLRGNGSHIISDTNYKGPAFIINSAAKHIVLDSLVFENFDVALLIQKNNVEFRNVRFINCRVAAQNNMSLPDSTLSGRFTESSFITNQSMKKR